MTYATLTTNLATYLTSAAATMSSPACNNVLAGEPTSVTRPLIAYWFLGIRDWDSHTLSKTQEQWGFGIRIYYPLGGSKVPPRAQVEQWVATLASAIRSQLYGHASAGSQATGSGVEVTETTTGYDDVNGVRSRTAEMEWWADMAEVASIAL